ncbi:MAG: hypothetical protein FD163_1567 [Hyphomonadaceae bacterium]|nr:MAG: hypothetical protein FD128_562 [Hyphomonadaceae bacterium]KAF0184870.1 MAG: hypothetical protein FD163_1567 [Hyphomonadaceae bacterium]
MPNTFFKQTKNKFTTRGFDELQRKKHFDAGFWSFNVGTILISCFYIYLFLTPDALMSLTVNRTPQHAFMAALIFTIFFMNISFWVGRLIIWLKYK